MPRQGSRKKQPLILATLHQMVVDGWTFDEENYPVLAGLDQDQRFDLILKHLHLHLNKATGTIAAQLEAGDHGTPADHVAIREAVCKIVMNALRLADLINLDGDHLTAYLAAMLREKK